MSLNRLQWNLHNFINDYPPHNDWQMGSMYNRLNNMSIHVQNYFNVLVSLPQPKAHDLMHNG